MVTLKLIVTFSKPAWTKPEPMAAVIEMTAGQNSRVETILDLTHLRLSSVSYQAAILVVCIRITGLRLQTIRQTRINNTTGVRFLTVYRLCEQ